MNYILFMYIICTIGPNNDGCAHVTKCYNLEGTEVAKEHCHFGTDQKKKGDD